MAIPMMGVAGTPGVANPTVLPCGNLLSMFRMRRLAVAAMRRRHSINKLKKRSSAITMRMSRRTTEMRDAKNSFNTTLGFLVEIGTPLIS